MSQEIIYIYYFAEWLGDLSVYASVSIEVFLVPVITVDK